MLNKAYYDQLSENLSEFYDRIIVSWNDYKEYLKQVYDFTMTTELEAQRLANLYFFSENNVETADSIITFLISGRYFDFFYPGKEYLEELYPPEVYYNESFTEVLTKKA